MLAEGYSKVDCIKATASVLRLSMADAKHPVPESAAGQDVRSADDEWHEHLGPRTGGW